MERVIEQPKHTLEMLRVNQFSFAYPNCNHKVLDQVNLSLNYGEFVVLCGKSGCGKTTLLRCMKPQIAPVGKAQGRITEYQASEIGFVFQNPDNQIVTDTVRHELAFGLENLGMPVQQIRARVAETALFFGIDEWIDKSVHEISGGEKQLLNLAAVIAMQPKLLILDEPTSQLDPVAQKNFLDMLVRVNRELGITVFLSEHRLDQVLPIADRVLFMKEGTIAFQGDVQSFVQYVFDDEAGFVPGLPAASRIGKQVADKSGGKMEVYPLTVRECQEFLRDQNVGIDRGQEIEPERKLGIEQEMKSGAMQAENCNLREERTCLNIQNIWFQYVRQTPFVLKGLNLNINWGQMHMILGGNGSGKSTLLGLLSKRFYASRGRIRLGKEKRMPKIELLPQNPKAMFSRDTVRQEVKEGNCPEKLVEKLRLTNLMNQHPYDLSGGEQQRLGLCLVLARKPDLLLLDEPTKGLDPFLKEELAAYLKDYTEQGNTVLCVTHDVEFAAKYGEVCSMLFEGEVLSTQKSEEFFQTNLFYTTDERRIMKMVHQRNNTEISFFV